MQRQASSGPVVGGGGPVDQATAGLTVGGAANQASIATPSTATSRANPGRQSMANQPTGMPPAPQEPGRGRTEQQGGTGQARRPERGRAVERGGEGTGQAGRGGIVQQGSAGQGGRGRVVSQSGGQGNPGGRIGRGGAAPDQPEIQAANPGANQGGRGGVVEQRGTPARRGRIVEQSTNQTGRGRIAEQGSARGGRGRIVEGVSQGGRGRIAEQSANTGGRGRVARTAEQPGAQTAPQAPSGPEVGTNPAKGNPAAGPVGWIRVRMTRRRLRRLPALTARQPGLFGLGGLRWLPPASGALEPALVLHARPGAAPELLAVAEIATSVLRGTDTRDLAARLGDCLATAPAAGTVRRIQLLYQVPGPGGRTRAYAVLALAYHPALLNRAAKLCQGERGLVQVATRAAQNVFSQLSREDATGGRLGPSVPLDRAAVTGLLGSLLLPGRGPLPAPRHSEVPWQPDEVDARAARGCALTGGSGARSATWWHATGWVKQWPRTIGGAIDLAAPAGFLPSGVTGAASVVLGPTGRSGEPAAAGFVTVSARDTNELELARVGAHAAAESGGAVLEFCDRRHHLAIARTLPMAQGLR